MWCKLRSFPAQSAQEIPSRSSLSSESSSAGRERLAPRRNGSQGESSRVRDLSTAARLQASSWKMKGLLSFILRCE